MKVQWLGHSSIKLETGNQSIYIDPYAGPEEWYAPCSAVLVSQWHYDHCNVAKLRKASNDATKVIGTPEMAAEIFPCDVLAPGKSREFADVEVVAMPAINPHVAHRGHTHDPVSKIGFTVLAENKKVYFMGDSDFLPQTADMKPDILLIAVGGTYTAAPREAADTTNRIAPKLAIPIHWGDVVGTRDDALLFSELVHVPVKILEPGESVEI